MKLVYVVSVDMDGSGADFVTRDDYEKDLKVVEYMDFLLEKRMEGTVTVRKTFVNEKECRMLDTDSSEFMDTVDLDSMELLFRKTYYPKRMKTKDDLGKQMNRIFRNHPKHRLYDKAQALVLKYNHFMSETPENIYNHGKYMYYSIWDKRKADWYLERLRKEPYHQDVYKGNG